MVVTWGSNSCACSWYFSSCNGMAISQRSDNSVLMHCYRAVLHAIAQRFASTRHAPDEAMQKLGWILQNNGWQVACQEIVTGISMVLNQ